MTDFQQAVEYVHSIGEWRSMKLGLERFTEFCARLGDPQRKFRCVHIGGTNGKGSTTAMVASILQAAGYKVGGYYSPFVYDIRERFLVNGEMIPEADFARLVEVMRPIAEQMESTEHGHPTEFELKTALAFLWFAEREVDFAVLEVGLGGRLDATNVVDPLVSAITNVGMDHTEHLGETIEQIAVEKAGIVKRNGHLVTAATGPAFDVIRERCKQLSSALWYVEHTDDLYRIASPSSRPSLSWWEKRSLRGTVGFRVVGQHSTYTDVKVRMRGNFQRINAVLAIGIAEALREECGNIAESAIYSGLESASLPGRMEVRREKPTLVLDGAHNPDAARVLADSLRETFEFDRLILVMGMVKGHSIEGVVDVLAPLADEFIATAPSGDRALPASEVADAARKHCSRVSLVEPVSEAARRALESAGENDLILVTGSFYTIGEVPRQVA